MLGGVMRKVEEHDAWGPGEAAPIEGGKVETSALLRVGDYNGTVKRPASEVFKHPERWFYLEFEVTDESFAEAKAWADERVRLNKGYSMKDIRRFLMPLWLLKKLKWDDPDRDICWLR